MAATPLRSLLWEEGCWVCLELVHVLFVVVKETDFFCKKI